MLSSERPRRVICEGALKTVAVKGSVPPSLAIISQGTPEIKRCPTPPHYRGIYVGASGVRMVQGH